MITRKDYMKDSTNLHHDYYMQFVNENVYNTVVNHFTKRQIAIIRRHYRINNDINCIDGITLELWDFCIILNLVSPGLLEEMGENRSMSTNICIAKATMRYFLDNS